MVQPKRYNINGVEGYRWTFKTNEEWRAERANSVGASAVGVLMGENYFRTPMELAWIMRDERNGIFNYEETEAMQDGHLLEDYVARKFALKSGHKIIKSSSAEYLLRRDGIPFMHASPDRTYWIDEDSTTHGKFAEQNKGMLECKSTYMKIDPDNLPLSWIFQLQAQMGISGYRQGFLAWLCKRTWEFGYQWFEYDEEVFNAAVEVCRDFWERCIVGGEDPEPVNARDIIAKYPKPIEGKTVTANAETLEVLETLREIKKVEKELKAEDEKLSDLIKAQFADAETMVDLDGKVLVTYKATSGRSSVDSKKLKEEYAEAYAACLKQSAGSRSLVIK